jgi:uncharacterized membrane protein
MDFRFEQYLFLFFVFSFCGWIIETTYRSVTQRRFVNPGVLFGPYVPLYGTGAVFLIILQSFAEGYPVYVRAPLYLVSLTFIEYVTGEVLYLVFKRRYWDYDDEPLNFRGQVCLSFSIYWMLLALIFENTLFPIALYLMQSAQFHAIISVDMLMGVVMSGDLLYASGIPAKAAAQAKAMARGLLPDLIALPAYATQTLQTNVRRISARIAEQNREFRAIQEIIMREGRRSIYWHKNNFKSGMMRYASLHAPVHEAIKKALGDRW